MPYCAMLILSYSLGMYFRATSLEQLSLAWSQLQLEVYKKNLEEIQDQIAINAKREIKVKKNKIKV